MERSFLGGVKGQASIEFILLIMLMLLYIQTLVLPEIDVGRAAARDSIGLGEARFAAEKVVNAVNYVGSSSGEAKETVSVFVPKGAVISCLSNGINFEYTVGVQKDKDGIHCAEIKDSGGNAVAGCVSDEFPGEDGKCYAKCAKTIAPMANIGVTCSPSGLKFDGGISGAMWKVAVEKGTGSSATVSQVP